MHSGGEGLHPWVDRYVIHGYATLASNFSTAW